MNSHLRSDDGTGALLGEPLLGIIGANSLELSEFTSGVLSLGNSLSSSGENDVEVHTENTSVGVVLDTKIDMLIDTETEVTLSGEIVLLKLVLLDLKSVIEENVSLLSSDGNMN